MEPCWTENYNRFDHGMPVWENEYAINPPVGGSLGVVNGKGSGTLGFYIRATVDANPPRYFAVTCSHVLAPEGSWLRSPRLPSSPFPG